jgi:hypothetical protein
MNIVGQAFPVAQCATDVRKRSAVRVVLVATAIDFSLPVDPAAQDAVTHPVPNCLRMPTAGGQWLDGTKWKYEKLLVSNKYVPDAKITTEIQEIKYS